MSHCVVTGAAGFVGSHLSQQLLAQGHTVTGIDAFIPYYPRPLKETNLAPLRAHANFRFVEADLRTAELARRDTAAAFRGIGRHVWCQSR